MTPILSNDAAGFVLLAGACSCLLAACNELAGIESKHCAPGCIDARTRLFCDERGEPRSEACPASTVECADPVCQEGICTFQPAIDQTCGRESLGACSGFACIGPETKLSANAHHTCLVGDDGAVWCWGRNADYELGDGTGTARGSPVLVRALPGEAIDVSAGYAHTCALLRQGSIACWGNNANGQCGAIVSIQPLQRPELVPISGVTFVALTAGRAHTCALSSERAVYCWGDTSYGQAGVDPSTGIQKIGPMKIDGLVGITGIETVKDHTCATSSTRGTFDCWGSNVYGEEDDHIVHKLGPNAAALRYSAAPVRVEFELPVLDVGISPDSSYATLASSGARAWGRNPRGLLGVGSEEAFVSAPADVRRSLAVELGEVRAVLRSGGLGQCVELLNPRNDNTSYLCWGENEHGELGLDGANPVAQYPDPVRAVPPDSRQLVLGEHHACAIASEDGRDEIWCYGVAHLVGNGTTWEDGALETQRQALPVQWNPDGVPAAAE